MEGIDDLARFYLWFIDAAGLGRPHLLGQSMGGWTAAEMASMSPGSIERLILVSAVGLKPATGEILDIFYHSPMELRGLTVHDPTTVPEWNELFGRPSTPAELEIAERNREMAARLTWKPYMHNPRLGRFLGRVTNPTLIVWGRQDRIVPLECGEQYRRLLPNATLTILDRCGHMPPIEQPDHFASLVLDFLGGAVRR
jgi:pimeloyl-ACP methyl ester carboxylesterase